MNLFDIESGRTSRGHRFLGHEVKIQSADSYEEDLRKVFVINMTGKGNLAPSSATDQVQNFVLGGIIGGVIYNSSITILQYAVFVGFQNFQHMTFS